MANVTGSGNFVDAYLGKHETYGTFPQWLEGEGAADLYPAGTEGFGLRPTYVNPVIEAIAENPVMNAFVDARGMLRQGGGPGLIDWGMLGLSGLPMVAPYARTAGTAIASKLRNKVADDILEPQLRAKDFQTTKRLDEPSIEGKSLSLVPEKIPLGGEKIIKKTYTGENASRYGEGPYAYLSNPKDPDLPVIYVGSALADYARMLNGNVILRNPPSVKDVLSMKARDFYALDRKMQDRLLENAGINRELWSYNLWIREGRDEVKAVIRVAEKKGIDDLTHERARLLVRSRELMHNYDRQIAALTDDQLKLIGIPTSSPILKTLRKAFKDLPPPAGSNIVKFEQRKFGHTPRIPESSLPVGELPTAKPITDMTWKEWDALYKPGMDVSDSQRALLRVNKEFKTADDVVEHFWGTGAREDYFAYLNQIVRDGKSIPDNLLEFVRVTDKKTKFPFKWNEIPYQNDSSVAALKHSFKPSHVDAKDWAKLTQFLDQQETINLARRMTLRLID